MYSLKGGGSLCQGELDEFRRRVNRKRRTGRALVRIGD